MLKTEFWGQEKYDIPQRNREHLGKQFMLLILQMIKVLDDISSGKD